jgi:hypothetical protein
MHILDVAVNPTNPPILGRYSANYVHDGYYRRGKGYLAEINAGNLRIVDTTNAANLTTLSATRTPGAFTHNAWVTEDDRLLITSDENSTGFLQVYDILNPSAPAPRGSNVLSGQIVHNVFGIGRTEHMAHYSAGYRMVDISNPSSPKEIAFDDTSTSTNGFNGAWGAFPWADSGVIYVGDRQNGFWCLQVDCGHINRFGTGTAGSGGKIPFARPEGATPMVGGTAFELRVSDAAPNTAVLLALGARGDIPVLGINLYIDVAQPFFLLVGATDANGAASFPIPIGNDPSLGNAKIHAQVITLDPSGPQGLAASRGMWFGICP